MSEPEYRTFPVLQKDRHKFDGSLRELAEKLGCQAAALYLIDPTNTYLVLRSEYGFSQEGPGHEESTGSESTAGHENVQNENTAEADRRHSPRRVRPMKGAVGDLEAMIGSVVTLDTESLIPFWNPPEKYPSSLCVAVASETMIWGTLWLFSLSNRTFSREQGDLEVETAYRIATELEQQAVPQPLTTP